MLSLLLLSLLGIGVSSESPCVYVSSIAQNDYSMKSFGKRKELVNLNIDVDYITVDGFKVYMPKIESEWEEEKVSGYFLFNSNSINIHVKHKKYDEVLEWLKKRYSGLHVDFNFNDFTKYIVNDQVKPRELCLLKNTNLFLGKAWAYEETLSAAHEKYDFHVIGEGYLILIDEVNNIVRMFIDDPEKSRYFDINYYPKSYSLESTMSVLSEQINHGGLSR